MLTLKQFRETRKFSRNLNKELRLGLGDDVGPTGFIYNDGCFIELHTNERSGECVYYLNIVQAEYEMSATGASLRLLEEHLYNEWYLTECR